LSELLTYFDSMFVSRAVRRSNQTNDGGRLLHLRQLPPIYPPSMWNLHTATLTGVEKTNNVCEGWNNLIHVLVGWASAPSTVDPAGCSATGRNDGCNHHRAARSRPATDGTSEALHHAAAAPVQSVLQLS